MKISIKTKTILSVVVKGAGLIVMIADIWEKNGPRIKNAVSSFVEECRKMLSINDNSGYIETIRQS